MATMFFYDEQIRRFLLQFIRMMSNFQVEFGTTDPATGKLALQTVPVFYGDASRQASQILRGMSENAMSTVPAMAVYINGLRYDRDRVQDPFHISKINIRQRMIDPVTGLPTSEQGDSFTVERLMPVPYKLNLKLDIWTSNTEQKLQLIEQIATLFNPSLEIQSTDNYIDWTSLSVVTLTDVSWDARSVPIGTEDPISVASLSFELPIWISPPAKLKRLGIIQKVVSSFWDTEGSEPQSSSPNYNGHVSSPLRSVNSIADAIANPEKLLTRRAWNFMRYGIVYTGNTLQLIKYDSTAVKSPNAKDDLINPLETIDTGRPDEWASFLSEYGVIKNGLSEIRLEQASGYEIIGTIALHPVDPTLLLFDPFIDTLPSNTIKPVNAIIDPQKINVNQWLIDANTNAYKVEAGTRFLILDDINEIGNSTWAEAWSPNGQEFTANANDIIEYDGTYWKVSFDSQRNIDPGYVTNLNTNIQYRWTGETWFKSYEGIYREDKWTIIL